MNPFLLPTKGNYFARVFFAENGMSTGTSFLSDFGYFVLPQVKFSPYVYFLTVTLAYEVHLSPQLIINRAD